MTAEVARVLPLNVHIRELFSLKDRVALVIGGAGRYGRQICQSLAESGAAVLVASRNFEKCAAYAMALKAEGFNTEALRLDLESEDSVYAAAEEIELRWRRVDVLFNSAVIVQAGPLVRHSDEEWTRAVSANSRAAYRACRVFGEMMAERGVGSIVNIASIYGMVSPDFRVYEGCPEMTNPPSYGFVKAGMIQLTRYFAVHFASRGVRVNSISPGGLFLESMPAHFVAEYEKRTPLGRMAGPNDLKGAAVFLASNASAYITGQNLVVDGGYTTL